MTSDNQTAESQDSASDNPEAGTGDLDALLNEHFAGKIVRKDLTKLVKEGANVPVFVLEYLLQLLFLPGRGSRRRGTADGKTHPVRELRAPG